MNHQRFRRIAVAVATVAIVTALFAAPAGASRSPAEGVPGTIADVLVASGEGFDTNGGDHDVLLAAMSAAGVIDGWDNTPLFAFRTLFAPKDRAFVNTARDLGFTGADTDEAGAWAFLLDVLTEIGDGDPLPTLTTILRYHAVEGTLGARKVLAATRFSTAADKGIPHVPGSTTLIDKDPDLPNPRLVSPQGVWASNGVIHTINRVLLPANL